MAGGQIDNAQAAVTERGSLIDKDPRIVWTTMRDHVAHPRDTGRVIREQSIRSDDTGNTAHISLVALPRRRILYLSKRHTSPRHQSSLRFALPSASASQSG